MAWSPSLHPRGPDGRFTRSFSRPLTEADRAEGNSILGRVKLTKLPTVEAVKSFFSQHASRYSTSEAGAIDSYTGDGFYEVNRSLRAGHSDIPDVKRLDAAMRPLPADLMLTRTVNMDAFKNVSPGDLEGHLVNDAAYASTSVGPHTYGGGLSGVTMHIVAPQGTPAILVGGDSRNASENEVILDRGTSMIVSKAVQNKYGGWDLYMIVVPSRRSRVA